MKSISKFLIYTSLSAACIYSHTSIGADSLVARIVTEDRTTTLKANVNTPMREIKALARQQLIEETVNILPTYIDSTQTISGNNYEEKIKFVAAAMVKVKNEDFDIKIENDLVTMTIRAKVSFDTNEIKRKVDKLESDEARSKLINSSISASTNLKSQARELETLYGLTAYQIQSEVSLQQTLDNYRHELVNLPLNDLVKEFELKGRMKEVEKKLAIADATNKEWLSLNEQERALYELNIKIGALINSSYMEQIKRPLTLKVVEVMEDYVTLQVAPLEGVSFFVPWYITRSKELKAVSSSYPFSNFITEEFYNYNCNNIYVPDGIDAWHSYVRQNKDSKIDLFSPGLDFPKSLKLSSLRQSVHVPGYNVPILLPYQFKNFAPNVGLAENDNANSPIVSLPIGLTWNLTKEEIQNKVVLPRGGEIFSLLRSKVEYDDVPVWGISLEHNGKRKVLPFITRMEKEYRNTNQHYRSRFMNNRVAYRGDEDKLTQIEQISHSSDRGFEHIKPYRLGDARCGIPTRLEYPKFKVSRQVASKLQNASIEVFRY